MTNSHLTLNLYYCNVKNHCNDIEGLILINVVTKKIIIFMSKNLITTVTVKTAKSQSYYRND